MTRCHGVTRKIARCRIDAGDKLFCHLHNAQPRYFFIIAVSSIFFSYIAGIVPVPWRNGESTPLTPHDFSVRLLVSAHANSLPLDYEAPARIAILARIGPAILESSMELQSKVAREYPGGRDMNRHWEYADKSPVVTNLPELTLHDLIGEKLTAWIPIRAFKFKSGWPGLTIFQLRVFVRGRELYAQAQEDGEVSLLLTRELLIGG